MLMYFIIFTVIGFIIGSLVKDINKTIAIIIVVSILWGLVNEPIWGLVTLGEISLGFFVYLIINKKLTSY
ncbi:hypothetical protein TSL6_02090 [Sulfurovum sp. TSL6]|uniref:hypothetical protein n=1 Tax=Sulfurovum sp. TSL6 TaxID=2826995 RepID=UPI001CC53403|nr:hypothetical protein [Sulfurovum sp. TSL6]GIT99702.1 hypothetical protein TSL6_02090 [Sulfurovum sp. TSL6]